MKRKETRSPPLALTIVFFSLVGAVSQGHAAILAEGESAVAKDRELVLESNSEAKITRALPHDITGDDRVNAERLVKESINAIKVGDGSTSVRKIEELRGILVQIQDPWVDCHEICKGLIIVGDPQKYAICYWACVISGGPKATRIPIVPKPDFSR
jgi:hypothetical protein